MIDTPITIPMISDARSQTIAQLVVIIMVTHLSIVEFCIVVSVTSHRLTVLICPQRERGFPRTIPTKRPINTKMSIDIAVASIGILNLLTCRMRRYCQLLRYEQCTIQAMPHLDISVSII